MTAEHGALGMIELASVRLRRDIEPLLAAVEDALPSAAAGNLPKAARALAARLRLLMAAALPAPDPLPLGRLRDLAGGLPDVVRLDSDAVASGTSFAPDFGRIVLNVLLLAGDSLPAGGIVRLAGGAADLFVQIDGPNAAWPSGTALCLVDPAAARLAMDDTQTARVALTSLLAAEVGIRLSAVYPPHAKPVPAILRIGDA